MASAISIMVPMVWVAIQGGSVTWDAFNHHIYLGRQAIHGSRLLYDHFAVGGMSCQYPLGYAPLAGLLDAGWSGTAIFQALTFLAALCIPACWLIIWTIIPSGGKLALSIRIAGIALAMSGVLWWKLLTQTSNDTLGMTLAMWSIALSMLCIDGEYWTAHPRLRLVACAIAGAFSGLGLVVKLTQMTALLAAFSILFFVKTNHTKRLQLMISFGLTAAAVTLITGWSWGYDSWKACGSPIYPFMLDFFRKTIPGEMP